MSKDLSFNCRNGCGACSVRLVDFVTHATQAHEGAPWVTVASEPQIVSTCCGSPVDVWDERKQDIVAKVEAVCPPPTPAGCKIVGSIADFPEMQAALRKGLEDGTLRVS